MLSDLNDKRKNEIILFSNLIVTVKYLPEIMSKLKETRKDKTIDSITDEIISNSIVALSPYNKKRIKYILKSASVKGKDYKEFKASITRKFEKESKLNKKTYHFTDPVELFFATNKKLLGLLYIKRVNGQEIINQQAKEQITNEREQTIKDYIKRMFSEEEKQIARRKHE